MASARDINRRIKSVKNTQQITKAMKMVSSVRLRRAQERALATRPFTMKLSKILHDIASLDVTIENPLLEKREVKKIAYIIISADKGLAGAYNSNLMKEVVAELKDYSEDQYELITVGKKAFEYLNYRKYNITESFAGFSDKPTYDHARAIGKMIISKFLAKEVDEIKVIYTRFITALRQEVQIQRLLPIDKENLKDLYADEKITDDSEFVYLPDVKEVLGALLPYYIETTISHALFQAGASELGARMTAMTSATDNAGDLIEKLVLNYNKVRQAGITNELSEIVGGANSLK